MLTPKHKGRGRWAVMDGDREVAGPFADKEAALTHIAANTSKAAPEIGAAAVLGVARNEGASAKRDDFLSTREYQRQLGSSLAATRDAFLVDLLAVVLQHAGEDAAARCEPELRAIAADPKREAKRRLRLREIQKHGLQQPAQSMTRQVAA